MQGVMNMRWTKTLFTIALLSGLSAAASAQNIVTNGGFEDGNLSGWTLEPSSNSYLWAVGTSAVAAGLVPNPGLVPNSGTYFAYTGCNNPGCLAYGSSTANDLLQALTTVAGQSYTLSFYTSNDGNNANPSELDVYWGGTKVVGLNPVPGVAPAYTMYTATVTATGTSTNLEFLGEQPPSWFALDDVSVTAVPLPASVWLMLSGLVGVGAMARKRRAA
jgi:hypothetical protein